MKARIIITTKILAVAAASAVGCAPKGEPGAPVVADTAQSPENRGPGGAARGGDGAAGTRGTGPTEAVAGTDDPAALDAALAGALGPGALAPGAAKVPPEEKIKLMKLQFALSEMLVEEALAQAPRFRPLCDAQGYPLVGNVARKGGDSGDKVLQVSQFCRELRQRKRL